MNDTLLNRYISARGLKVNYVAEQLGISRQALHKKMSGALNWSDLEAEQVSRMLGIPAKHAAEIFRKN